MSPTSLGESSLWDFMDYQVEALDRLMDPSSCRQSYPGSLLLGPDLNLLSADAPAAWLVSDTAAGTEQKLVVDDLFQPCTFPATATGMGAAALHPGQPLVPALGSEAFAAAPLSSANLSLAGSDSASLGSGGQAIISPVPSSAEHAVFTSFQLQQEQPQPPAGAVPQQPPKAKGRPRADRSQMTGKQIKAIGYARAHFQRQRTNMRDLEERVADVRADLTRERAQQARLDVAADICAAASVVQGNSQRSIAVREQLLSYKDEMVATLGGHGQGAQAESAPGDATPFDHQSWPSSAGSLAVARPPLAALPMAAGNAELRQPGQLDRGKGTAAGATSSAGCSLCRRLSSVSIYNYTCSCGRRLGPGPLPGPTTLASLPEASWTLKHPATWAFVEDVRVAQLPRLLQPGPDGKVAVCLSSNYPVDAHTEQAHEGLQRIPDSYWDYLTMNGLDDLSAYCAAASAAVVSEVVNMECHDIVEAWRDYALVAREAVAEHDVTRNDAKALARVNPQMERLTILIYLAIVHNPALLKHLYLSSGDNLSDEQRRDKYDAVVAAMDLTPSQQERYLEMASSYDSFVQQVRQHKAEALARIGRSTINSPSASASLRQMVSGYLDALEGTHELSHYPDAEFIALLELMKVTARVYKPLQKARGAAAAYPQFIDILHVVEALRRLPSPDQRRRQLGAA
ncbi:hypothetical protein N2152v2_010206 [Parachlorella kessleri]